MTLAWDAAITVGLWAGMFGFAMLDWYSKRPRYIVHTVEPFLHNADMTYIQVEYRESDGSIMIRSVWDLPREMFIMNHPSKHRPQVEIPLSGDSRKPWTDPVSNRTFWISDPIPGLRDILEGFPSARIWLKMRRRNWVAVVTFKDSDDAAMLAGIVATWVSSNRDQ